MPLAFSQSAVPAGTIVPTGKESTIEERDIDSGELAAVVVQDNDAAGFIEHGGIADERGKIASRFEINPLPLNLSNQRIECSLVKHGLRGLTITD